MKRAIICFNCSKLKKEGESYWVKVKKWEKNDPNIYTASPSGGAHSSSYTVNEIKVKICRACAKKAGYKVKKIKKAVKHG